LLICPIQQASFAFELFQIRQVLHHFYRSHVFAVVVSHCVKPDEEKSVVEGYPELGNVLLAILEGFNDFADDVKAFFRVALGDFSADDGFCAHEEAFVGLVEVLYGVVCVNEGDVNWQRV
jgi:hypothetical protein